MKVIEQSEQVTPAWLTEQLKAKALLQQGMVTHIEFETKTFNKGYTADIVTLTVSYASDATDAQPRHLLLKIPKPDLHPEYLHRGVHEAKFYEAAATLGVDFPIPACYSAAYDETTHRAHILMADLSESHFQKPLPIPPSNRHCEMIVESLARLHAAWWNNPRLGVDVGERLSLEQAAASNQRLQATLPAFFDYLGDALLPQQRKAIEAMIASDFLTRLGQRLHDLRQVTLIHGDAHTGNLLLPHDTANHGVVLIDWQLWGIHVATFDLAFLMALHWSPQRRALLEEPLLRRYYAELSAHGVTNYSWDALWNDYREAVMIMALIPIGQFRRKSPAGVVWFGLQDSMAAYEDLHCAELL